MNPADHFSRGCSPQEYIDLNLWNLNVSNLVEQCAEPIQTKLICTINKAIDEDNGIRSWMDNLETGSKRYKWLNRIMQWMEKSTKRIRQRNLLSTLVLIYQRTEKVPDGCYDDNGVLRFESRDLTNRPIWVPKKCALAEELLRNSHRGSYHRGVDMSLAMLSPDIRVVGAKRLMRRIIGNCKVCRMLRGKSINQPLGPLHDQQKVFSRPFEDITLDAFGPMSLANGKKCYGVILVCRTTRSVKLGVLEDMSGAALWKTLIML